jgi:hypothetical protein
MTARIINPNDSTEWGGPREPFDSLWAFHITPSTLGHGRHAVVAYVVDYWKSDTKWVTVEATQDVGRVRGTPQHYILENNYPNPFNPSTEITYALPKQSTVVLRIYDILSREVATLVNEKKQAGEYTVEWKATNVPSGVYFYRLIAGYFVQTKKMVLTR